MLAPPPLSLYKALIENMAEAVWVGDEQEHTIYANPKFCELMEYSLEEMLGRQSYDFWDDESAERVRTVNVTKRKKGLSSSYEGTLMSKTGKRIPVLLHGSPLPEGGTVGIMTDLRVLKQSESLYQQLVENMNEAVWMGDSQEKTIYANPKFCSMMGYTLKEMFGKESYYFWDPESVKTVKAVNVTDRKRGLSSSYEGTLLTKNGEKIPVLTTGTPLPHGGTIGILTDLRMLKDKEAKEKILSTAISYATDAIIGFNSTGEVQSWNKGAQLMFGYRQEEMLGSPLNTIFPKKVLHKLFDHTETVYNFEIQAKHKNKRKVSIAATITPITAENGEKGLFYLLISRDITHQLKTEEELALKYQKIKEAYNNFGIIRRQMDYIFEILDLVSQSSDQKSLSDFIVASIIMLTKVDGCVFRLYNPKRQSLDLASTFGVGDDWRGKSSITYKNSLAEKAFTTKNPLKIIDVSKDTKYQSRSLAKKHHFCSLLLIPLVHKEQLIGSISLYTSPEKKLEIFENEFIENYAKLIELIMGTMVVKQDSR
ncbi:MAG: PAS domain S-box protein [bacterium]|nr:PAS domain S-box protein [bacterium]